MAESKAELTDRWRRENREEEVARFRRQVRDDCRAQGVSKKEAHEAAWSEAARNFPPLPPPKPPPHRHPRSGCSTAKPRRRPSRSGTRSGRPLRLSKSGSPRPISPRTSTSMRTSIGPGETSWSSSRG